MPSDDLVKYFITHTDKRFNKLDEDNKALEEKFDKIIGLRNWALGAAFGAGIGGSGLGMLIVKLASAWARVK